MTQREKLAIVIVGLVLIALTGFAIAAFDVGLLP